MKELSLILGDIVPPEGDIPEKYRVLYDIRYNDKPFKMPNERHNTSNLLR